MYGKCIDNQANPTPSLSPDEKHTRKMWKQKTPEHRARYKDEVESNRMVVAEKRPPRWADGLIDR